MRWRGHQVAMRDPKNEQHVYRECRRTGWEKWCIVPLITMPCSGDAARLFVEKQLIRMFRPPWNTKEMGGFGGKDIMGKTYRLRRSRALMHRRTEQNRMGAVAREVGVDVDKMHFGNPCSFLGRDDEIAEAAFFAIITQNKSAKKQLGTCRDTVKTPQGKPLLRKIWHKALRHGTRRLCTRLEKSIDKLCPDILEFFCECGYQSHFYRRGLRTTSRLLNGT